MRRLAPGAITTPNRAPRASTVLPSPREIAICPIAWPLPWERGRRSRIAPGVLSAWLTAMVAWVASASSVQ
jgi:hypothetical protein